MSVENLKEYARRCEAEPELRAKAKEIGLSDVDEHMRQAESLGLGWTRGDLEDFRKEVIDAEGDLQDLSEADLEQVAGGVNQFDHQVQRAMEELMRLADESSSSPSQSSSGP